MNKNSEKTFKPRIHGVAALLAALVLIASGIALCTRGEVPAVLAGIAAFLCAALFLVGLTLVNPNHARVVLLFGKYIGTIRNEGFYCVNPFTSRKDVSLRVRNFESSKLKVNDEVGNPIEIAAIVVWRVNDTAQAVLDVENFDDYVHVQSESALRQLATHHPYDSREGGETSLRGSTDLVNTELQHEVADRLKLAGIEVLEARLSHLAYAPEIAGTMLRRQQAEAIIDARQRIVEGAVGMVKMALDQMQQQQVVELDRDRRAALVSNLLVVLCSESEAKPVVRADNS